MVRLFAMLRKTFQAVADILCNIANKRTIRIVSRSVEPTLFRLRALTNHLRLVKV